MPQNFLACDREQELLLPPSLREWLPENHLAWCVIDAVGEFDLAAFYVAYRADGWGRAAHERAMMVALLLYAYAIGGALVAADRAPLRARRRVSGDRAEPGARSRHDRALPRPPRAGVGGAVRGGVGVVRGGRAGPGGRGRGRWHEGARQCVPARDA